ncbi:hypothetical protein CPB84DRAFT_181469 [Gymnopilus junonius]|uniref:Uncharacterized protein n=1 Tax=Gymnopilus junonius TaxID=109634 RepID=A0A9P5TI73_GYMJU|nr:hypothetical protein CPB84DRAFT_181469 [Gymnopilus junonius]
MHVSCCSPDRLSKIMSLSMLSQEIIDEIVDILQDIDSLSDSDDDDNSESFQFSSYALISKNFRPRTQQISFAYVIFRFSKNDSSSVTKLRDQRNMLERNPKIAGYFRTLVFFVKKANLWTFDHPDFIRMMELIAKASKGRSHPQLDIEFDSARIRPRIPDHSAQRVLEVIGPHVRNLDIHGIDNVPFRWIADCSNLVKLDMVRISLAKNDPETTPSLLPRLHVLILSWPANYIATIDRLTKFALDPSCLRKFQTEFEDELCIAGVGPVIKACRSSLEHLKISCNEGRLRIANLANLSEIPNLKILSFKIDLSWEDHDDALEDLCALLNTSSNDNKIEEITLELHVVANRRPGVGALGRVAEYNWRMVDSTMVRLSNNKKLKIDIQIYYFYEPESDLDENELNDINEGYPNDQLEGWMAEQLPLASRRSHIALHAKFYRV